MEQYMSKTRADYGSGVARPKIEDKDNFELKGQFLKELRTNTSSGSDHEDANDTSSFLPHRYAVSSLMDTAYRPWKRATNLNGKAIVDTHNPVISEPAQRTTCSGHKRLTKKGQKLAALALLGTEVSCQSLGASSYECRSCNATMWYEERNNKGNWDPNPTFSLCCQQGTGWNNSKESDKNVGSEQCHFQGILNGNGLVSFTYFCQRRVTLVIRENKLHAVQLTNGCRSGPRYMMQNHQEAMALCRAYGNPDLFITFTSNPKWSEINEMLAHILGQRSHDHPEVGVRVFKLKLTGLLDDLTKNQVFEESRAAELPSPTDDPVGYKDVTDYMLHGPYGKDAKSAACVSHTILVKLASYT
ncbi:DNA helicase PIF1, ATP-dependent [Tanacetum coccineum]|uniref:DNA helicase PIF1, ATP-dependent n=1 Tax=Tanacetum coccineum TaxID=301880 RepID=A0ABQ5GNZ0_9ASTR